MKKIISLLLVSIMLLSISGIAEEFTLRNGICFGDTMEEVLEKESFAIDEMDDGTDEEEAASSDDDDDEDEFPYYIETVEGTVAGISGSYIKYNFDADKTLREVIYYFDSNSSKDLSDSDYDSVQKGLIRKYGSPLGYSNGDCYIVSGAAIESAVISAYLWEMMGGYGDIRNYDEWDVDTGEYHVKIELAQYYWGNSYSELLYCNQMSYTYFTDADLEAAKAEKQEAREAVDNDL